MLKKARLHNKNIIGTIMHLVSTIKPCKAWNFFFSPHPRIYLLIDYKGRGRGQRKREREKERKRGREKRGWGERERNIDWQLLPGISPFQGWNTQPWHVPWPGTETHTLLVYKMTLQPTEPPGQGKYTTLLYIEKNRYTHNWDLETFPW